MYAILILAVMGALLGLGLAFAAEFLKVEVDPRLAELKDLLPGYECGACGFPGCQAFAEGILDGEVERLAECKPGRDTHYQAIIDFLKDHPDTKGNFVKVKK